MTGDDWSSSFNQSRMTPSRGVCLDGSPESQSARVNSKEHDGRSLVKMGERGYKCRKESCCICSKSILDLEALDLASTFSEGVIILRTGHEQALLLMIQQNRPSALRTSAAVGVGIAGVFRIQMRMRIQHTVETKTVRVRKRKRKKSVHMFRPSALPRGPPTMQSNAIAPPSSSRCCRVITTTTAAAAAWLPTSDHLESSTSQRNRGN